MATRPNPPEADETLTDILADDEGVDALPDARVKEAYVKQKLFEVVHEGYLEPRHGRNSMNNDEYDRLMKLLEDWGPIGVQQTLLTFKEAFSSDLVAKHANRDMTEDQARAVIRDVFEAVTDTAIPEAERVAVVREELKTALRGCGMPRHKIARAVVQDHKSAVAVAE